MPDLNLIDDENAELSSEAESAPVTKGGGGGGGGRMIIIGFMVVLISAGTLFVLNSRGVIHLWGNKKPAPVTYEEPAQENAFDESAFNEQPQTDSTQAQPGQQGDVAMLETTPLDEQGTQPSANAPAGTTEPKEMSLTGSKLADMKGDYTVQVVAFREKEKADEILQNLEVAGYPAFVEKVPMKGGDWYTVRIGRYSSRTDAKEAVKTFAEQIRSNYVIDKIHTR